MTLDALDNVLTALMTEPMAREQGIYMDNWDLRATKEVTGYDRVVSLRVMNVRTAWDRGSLRAKEVYWRTERSRGGPSSASQILKWNPVEEEIWIWISGIFVVNWHKVTEKWRNGHLILLTCAANDGGGSRMV